MEQVLHSITPGDPPGLYNIVSPELDSRFDVPNDIPYRKLFDRLVGLSVSLVASFPRMSTESKTIMALFAMCGKSTINRLMNEVSRLKNEEKERERRNTNRDQDSLFGDETNVLAEHLRMRYNIGCIHRLPKAECYLQVNRLTTSFSFNF